MGFYLGFGGMLTYERSTKLRALLKAIPLEHIVLETDAPDMVVSQHRGTRNSPEYLPYILDAVAKCLDSTREEVARVTTQNVQSLFELKP